MFIYSPAMHRDIQLQLLRALHPGRPTLYLLNGAEDDADTTWETKTDMLAFMAAKDVNVVTVVDGKYSYYTDWLADDPVLGRNKWTTFLTRELPPLINGTLAASGRNAIAGVSMSATSALALATAQPGLYRSVGSFSGCAQSSADPGKIIVQGVVRMGGGDPSNMWGPDNAPGWRANDPTTDVNLAKLRGTNIVLAAGNGVPGPHDVPGQSDQADLQRQVGPGGLIETAAGLCTEALSQHLLRLGIPATVVLTPYGTHAWRYWQDDLHTAWPSFARSLGI